MKVHIKMKRLLSVLVCLTVLSFASVGTASALSAEPPPSTEQKQNTQIINTVPPRPQGLNIYVNDFAHLLTPEDKALLQEKLQAVDEAGIAQVSVLILPDTDRDLSEFAPIIMKEWDIQHYKKKDGLLILVNAERVKNNLSGNRIFVTTGYALEEVLPDALVGRVLDEQAIPAFQQGNPSQGVTQATLTLAKILAGDKDLQSKYAEPQQDIDPRLIVFILIALFFLFFNNRRNRGGGGFYGGGGYGSGFGGGFGGGSGGGFSGGFGGGGDAGGGGGSGR